MKIADKTILVVEDENAIREHMVRSILRHSHCNVVSAANGKEAVEKFNAHKPQYVFLDLGLPDIDGFEVLKRIKATGISVHVCIVTGFNDDVHRQKATILGAENYITKPVEFEVLLKILQEQNLTSVVA